MKNKLDVISCLSGSSKASVSRAINHCFGVERESRERIVAIAKEFGVGSSRECDFYCILPDRPQKFWSEFIVRFENACGEGVRGKYNVYPQGSELLLGEYLDEAKRLGARIILICARPNEKQYEMLSATAREIPIIFLFDRVSIPNTFCICTDSFADGKLAREMACLNSGARVLVVTDGTDVSTARAEGFSCGEVDAVRIEMPDTFTAAELARRVSELNTGSFDTIYATVGSAREAAIAALKLGYSSEIGVVGHDYADSPIVTASPNGIEYVTLCPNAAAICEVTVKALRDYIDCDTYPSEKYTVISSEWSELSK